MKVILTQGLVGVTEKGVTWAKEKGDEFETTEAEGKRLIERGIAVAPKVDPPKRS